MVLLLFILKRYLYRSHLQECNIDSEVCCQIRVPTTPRPTPPATRATYIPPPPPTRAQLQPTPCYDRNSVCAPANQCYNGAVQRNSPYASRSPVRFIRPVHSNRWQLNSGGSCLKCVVCASISIDWSAIQTHDWNRLNAPHCYIYL